KRTRSDPPGQTFFVPLRATRLVLDLQIPTPDHTSGERPVHERPAEAVSTVRQLCAHESPHREGRMLLRSEHAHRLAVEDAEAIVSVQPSRIRGAVREAERPL